MPDAHMQYENLPDDGEPVSGDALLTEERKHTFGEPVRLCEVRVAGQDELVEARRVVFGDQVRHFLVAAHECSTCAAAIPACRLLLL